MALYWTIGSVYIIMDWLNWPQWLRKYKVQPGTNQPVDTRQLFNVIYIFVKYYIILNYNIHSSQVIGQALFNQICVGFFSASLYWLVRPKELDIIHCQLPSLPRVRF